MGLWYGCWWAPRSYGRDSKAAPTQDPYTPTPTHQPLIGSFPCTWAALPHSAGSPSRCTVGSHHLQEVLVVA